MSKAADAFRTISEVADDLEVPKHVLRFWENRFPQIKPMKRGGGRRYYRPADLELLRGIRHLLHSEGFTIKGVQKILREQGVDAVKSAAQPGNAVRKAGVADGATGSRSALRDGKRGKAVRGGASTSAAAPIDRKAVLDKVIAELKLCRSLLIGQGEASATATQQRAARR
jgi:DNA-binding transcriptional MerR regulator